MSEKTSTGEESSSVSRPAAAEALWTHENSSTPHGGGKSGRERHTTGRGIIYEIKFIILRSAEAAARLSETLSARIYTFNSSARLVSAGRSPTSSSSSVSVAASNQQTTKKEQHRVEEEEEKKLITAVTCESVVLCCWFWCCFCLSNSSFSLITFDDDGSSGLLVVLCILLHRRNGPARASSNFFTVCRRDYNRNEKWANSDDHDEILQCSSLLVVFFFGAHAERYKI